MTESLSKEEADEIVEKILPTIKKGLNINGEASIRFSDIIKTTDAALREGSTPYTYCKIAQAAFKKGISTETRGDKNGNIALSFRNVRKGEAAPTSAFCKFDWKGTEEDIVAYRKLKTMGFSDEEIKKGTIKALADLPGKERKKLHLRNTA
jgi:hypothetical protein